MSIEVKNSVKPIDYTDSIEILENRVNDVILGKKNELLWILEHNTVYTAGTSSNENDLLDKNGVWQGTQKEYFEFVEEYLF